MSFNTENRKISEIFQRSCRYVVPRYQREYVWVKTNWSELINDIKFTLKSNEKLNWSHFLGTIVLNNQTKQNGKSEFVGIIDYEIVDGQQRLTTLYILLACLCYAFKKLEDESANNRAGYLFSTFLISLDGDARKVLAIDNIETNDSLEEIIQNVHDVEYPLKNNFYYKLFDYFYSEIKEYSFEELDLFMQKLLDINIVEIVSDQEEEIYNIFEVLNARGQKLKQIELLKNHIMKYIQPRTTDIVDKAKKKWNELIENSSHLSNIDVLLNHFSKCYIKRIAENADSVYKLIKEEIKIDDLSEFLDDFLEYTRSYKKISSKDNYDEYIQYFDIKRNQQIRCLLAAIQLLFDREIISQNSRDLSFKNLRNFFFIFNVCSFTSNKTDDLISNYSYEIFRVKHEMDFKYIITRLFQDLNTLIKNEDKYSMFDSNTSLKYSNKNKNYKRNGKLVKYVLYCIYRVTQTDTLLNQDTLTIEHLISDDGSAENSSLQNLTLTSELINGDYLRNKSLDEKIKILSEKSTISENIRLSSYIENNEFNFEKRKENIKNIVFNQVFYFDLTCFGLTSEDVKQYFKLKENLKSSEKLIDLLEIKGKNLYIYLSSNPNEKENLHMFNELTKEKGCII